jgi:hypothetical protein
MQTTHHAVCRSRRSIPTLASGSYADPFEHGGVEFGYGEDAFTLRWRGQQLWAANMDAACIGLTGGFPEERYDDR